jgi:transcriptional regulator with XRE-family HTH domain
MDTQVAAGEEQVYLLDLGRQLRAARRARGLSLKVVEAMTSGEFKASALGAYERAQRTISVVRLHRLARFYHVPVDRLLPADDLVDVVIDLREDTEVRLPT